MKSDLPDPDKALYKQLRALPPQKLWTEEVTRFNQSGPRKRFERVAVIRAVGAAFSTSGTIEQKQAVRLWLRQLLHDPNERIRRYAMAALPKVGAGPAEESELLALLRTTASDREKGFLQATLEKIGGAASLQQLQAGAGKATQLQTEQKIKANVARLESPSAVRLNAVFSDRAGIRLHLRCRIGLEEILRTEVEQNDRVLGKFEVREVTPGLVAVTPKAPVTLTDVFALRCFASVGFFLGTVGSVSESGSIDRVAALITSDLTQHLLKTLTQGSIRYRLNLGAKGHQRAAVRLIANRAYALCPEILNDPRSSAWEVTLYPAGNENSVELCLKSTWDPRFSYRQSDVAAASHPPLAAAMARLAGHLEHEIVWDPFCGSGVELIERALLGGIQALYGTDRSRDAIAAARLNFAAAKIPATQIHLRCGDFRDAPNVGGLGPHSATLMMTNPPLGKRVPVENLNALIGDLFSVAAKVLRPGGRLVLINPLPSMPHASFALQSRQMVDLGVGFCALELHRKSRR